MTITQVANPYGMAWHNHERTTSLILTVAFLTGNAAKSVGTVQTMTRTKTLSVHAITAEPPALKVISSAPVNASLFPTRVRRFGMYLRYEWFRWSFGLTIPQSSQIHAV